MDRLVVATLNIWNKSGPWPERLGAIRRELSALAPDVIGLQEVLRMEAMPEQTAATDQATEIAEGMGYQIAYAKAQAFGAGLAFGNALLSRHPILESRGFILPGSESGETRCLLYARVATPHGQLPVFVTHLNWKLHHGSVRLSQVRAIVDKLFELAPVDDEHLPPVLMGDFNAEPDSDEIRFLRGLATIEGRSVYLADVWSYAGQGPGYTFDRKNRFAALAHEPPRRIDYIFVRGPDRKFRGEPVSARLCFATASAAELWPSDHFGVVSELVASVK
jgi:endonuclease/exonuclease/phosphatase family metal-dependent hydrolase